MQEKEFLEKPRCPRCGSDHVRKYGFTRSRKQQYFCNDCKKKYIGVHIPSVKPNYGKCPYCGNTDLVSKGYRKGKHRFLCKTCNKHFTEGVEIKYYKKPPCPYCGSQHIHISQHRKDGITYYGCQDCGRYFRDHIELTPKIARLALMYHKMHVKDSDIVKHFKILPEDFRKLVKSNS